MKIGNNNSTMIITLSTNEIRWLTFDRVNVVFQPNSEHEFVKLVGDPKGQHGLLAHTDSTHPKRIDLSNAFRPSLPVFGIEQVVSRTHSISGIIFGTRPKMSKVLQNRTGRGPQPVAPISQMPGIEQLREAVTLVNNLKRQFGDQMTLHINAEGGIEISMSMTIK